MKYYIPFNGRFVLMQIPFFVALEDPTIEMSDVLFEIS